MSKLLRHPAFLAGTAALCLSAAAAAETEPFIGQVIPVGENFCPQNYLPAAGQMLSIASNTALFSLVGCNYGGDCRSTFALPDLRGRAIIGTGQGPGLPDYQRGQHGGSTQVSLTPLELPNHHHSMMASTQAPQLNSPQNGAMPTYQYAAAEIYSDQNPGSAQMNPDVLGHTGASTPMSIVQPTATINYCIAVFGLYPSRN